MPSSPSSFSSLLAWRGGSIFSLTGLKLGWSFTHNDSKPSVPCFVPYRLAAEVNISNSRSWTVGEVFFEIMTFSKLSKNCFDAVLPAKSHIKGMKRSIERHRHQ